MKESLLFLFCSVLFRVCNKRFHTQSSSKSMKNIFSSKLYLFIQLLLVLVLKNESKENVTIVALAPMTGEWDVGRTTAAAIPIAIEDINNDSSLLPNHELQFVFGNTNCSHRSALPLVMNTWVERKRNVDAYIGGGCNRVCEYISLLAGKWNLPVVSWGCMSSHLSNRITFPTFARTVGPYTKMEKLLKKLMKHFNWKRVAIIASTDDIWQIAANLIQIELAKHGIMVAHFHSFIPGRLHILERRIERHADLIKSASRKARSKSNVVVHYYV